MHQKTVSESTEIFRENHQASKNYGRTQAIKINVIKLNGLKTNDSMKLSKRIFKQKIKGCKKFTGQKTLEPKK